MSKSTPDDLAVAFRSLARRLREAQNDKTPPDVVAAADSEIHGSLTAAATVLGSAATAEGVAAAIQERHTADWTDSDLEALQTHANDAARAIRAVEDATPA